MSHRGPGPVGTSTNTGTPRQHAKADPRQRAIDLGAADARAVLRAALPFVLEHMTRAQIDQMQHILDGLVLDPVIQAEAQDLYNRATKRYGSLVIQDEHLVHKADKVMRGYIFTKEADRRMRLDYKDLLDADALKIRTDNPDEAEYLKRVKATLDNRGVWLHFNSKLVKDPQDLSRRFYDPRTIEVWLTLGPDGDTMPATGGHISRDTILGTTLLGAGYYTHVDTGPVQAKLDKEVRRLTINIEAGLEQHQALAKIRRDAMVGVTELSDLFGGAKFPDTKIWEQPNRLVTLSLKLNVGGNVYGSQAVLIAAAMLTRNASALVANYINDSSSGVERIVPVLKVLKTAGEVAEVGLAVTGVYSVVRGSVTIIGGAGAATAGGGGAAAVGVDEAAEQLLKRYVAKNPEIAGELNNVRYVKQPPGSIGGGVKAGTSAGSGNGFSQWP